MQRKYKTYNDLNWWAHHLAVEAKNSGLPFLAENKDGKHSKKFLITGTEYRLSKTHR